MTALSACAVLAVLELDAVLIAQTLLSRPLIVGSIIGTLTGKAQAGALFGAVFELLGLCDLPVGGALAWSATVAAGTAAVLVGGGTSFSLSFVGGIVAGVLHSRAEAFERKRRAKTGDELARRAEAGGWALGNAMGVSIALHAAMTFVVAGAVVALFGFIDRSWWPGAPKFLLGGVQLVSSSAPWIGLSGIVAWGMRRA